LEMVKLYLSKYTLSVSSAECSDSTGVKNYRKPGSKKLPAKKVGKNHCQSESHVKNSVGHAESVDRIVSKINTYRDRQIENEFTYFRFNIS